MTPLQEHETEYTSYLPNGDRVTTRFISIGKSVKVFAVVYWALIKGRWHKVRSFDNSHDAEPHEHHYHLKSEEFKVVFPWSDPSQGLTEAQTVIKLNYQHMRATYLQIKHKRLR